MPEESGDVPQAIRLVAMDGFEVVGVSLLEIFAPYAVELAEAFTNKPIEI